MITIDVGQSQSVEKTNNTMAEANVNAYQLVGKTNSDNVSLSHSATWTLMKNTTTMEDVTVLMGTLETIKESVSENPSALNTSQWTIDLNVFVFLDAPNKVVFVSPFHHAQVVRLLTLVDSVYVQMVPSKLIMFAERNVKSLVIWPSLLTTSPPSAHVWKDTTDQRVGKNVKPSNYVHNQTKFKSMEDVNANKAILETIKENVKELFALTLTKL